MTFDPIGVFRGGAAYKYEAPRQGVFAGGAGRVELAPGRNFETALRGLEGFERIWLVFVFDRNAGAWRPTTRPPVPVPGLDRVGTFASRAPYRPNPIGLSCVRLAGVRGRILDVEEADLLDGTPILDVKPYVPAADAFPEARAGWLERGAEAPWRVETTPAFEAASAFVREAGGPDLARTARLQLSPAILTRSGPVPSPRPSSGCRRNCCGMNTLGSSSFILYAISMHSLIARPISPSSCVRTTSAP